MNLWDEVLARVEAKVNRHSFATWFRPTSYGDIDGDRLKVRVPNAQFKDWMDRNYQAVISEALTEIGRGDLRVVFDSEADAPPAGESERDGTATSFLNPKYTFESFVVGSSNQFAHAAARAVAEIPSKSYNPLFPTAGWGWARRTSCTPSATTSRRATATSSCSTSRPTASSTR
jgi:chromosomal replication initiator protein